MKSHIYFFLTVVGIHAFLLTTVSAKYISGLEQVDTSLVNGSSPETNLRLIGTIDGKSYYIDITNSKTWTETDIFCRDANLELGTIETDREWDFLQANIPNYVLWTGGREYLTMTGWNNKAPVDPAAIKVFAGGTDSGGARCLALFGTTSTMNYPCTSSFYSLCQSM